MRRLARRNEEYFVERAAYARFLGDEKMAEVNRVEGAAHQAQASFGDGHALAQWACDACSSSAGAAGAGAAEDGAAEDGAAEDGAAEDGVASVGILLPASIASM